MSAFAVSIISTRLCSVGDIGSLGSLWGGTEGALMASMSVDSFGGISVVIARSPAVDYRKD